MKEKILGLLVLVVLLLGAGGYITNIVKLFGADEINIEVAVRLAGMIVIPVGAVLGYL